MILTTKDTAEAGKPIRIFDADGNEIRLCTRCDTETGECEVFETDKGGAVMTEITSLGIAARRTIVHAKPPLKVEWV